MKIYHNPRCSKSRQGLEILQNTAMDFEIIDYIKNPISTNEIIDILTKLKIKPIELVRKNESIWKESYNGKNLTDNEIINALAENPKLIERPIVIHGEKAVIGRPPENILSVL